MAADVVKFTDEGATYLVESLCDTWTTGNVMKYVGWGTTATAAQESDTDLLGEQDTPRVTGALSHSGQVYTVVATKTATTTRTVVEAGIFDASTAGNIYVRATFDSITVQNGDSIQFTFNLTFNNA